MSQSPTPPSSDHSQSSSTVSSDNEADMPQHSINTTCTICRESFTCPKVLSCFHTFCKTCLEKIAPDTSAESLVCPTCNEVTFMPNGLAGLVPDYAVGNVLEASALDNPKLQCTACKKKEERDRDSDNVATHRCFDCANFLCEGCATAHKYMNIFAFHRVMSLADLKHMKEQKQEKQIMCMRHKSQNLCIFCRTCNVPICRECTVLDHGRGHEYDLISDHMMREVEMIRQLGELAKVKATDLRGSSKNIEHSKNRLQFQYDKARTEIENTHAFYLSQLEDRKAEVIKELDSVFNLRKVKLNSTVQKMAGCVDELRHSSEFIKKLLNHTSMTEILVMKKMIETKLASILAFSPDVNLSNQMEVDYFSNYQAIQVGVRNTFGYVRCTTNSPPEERSIQPIARPTMGQHRTNTTGAGSPPLPMYGSSSAYNGALSNGFSHLASLQSGFESYSTHGAGAGSNSLVNMRAQFPSDSSIATMHSNTTGSDSWSHHYKEWSNADYYQSQSQHSSSVAASSSSTAGDVFASAADPVLEVTQRMFNANIYPPKSQIKRQKMIYHCKFGEFGVSEGQFTEPSGVAVNAQNDIIVADTNNHRIQIFDKEGRFKFQFGECGKRDGQLLYPNRVAVVKSSGDIVFTERSPTHQVQVYNQYGQFVRKFGANILQHPRGVTVDRQGRIIIVECKVSSGK